MGHGDMGNGEMGNGHVDPHHSPLTLHGQCGAVDKLDCIDDGMYRLVL